MIEIVGTVAIGAVWGWLLGLALARPPHLVLRKVASKQASALLLVSGLLSLWIAWLTHYALIPLFIVASTTFFSIYFIIMWTQSYQKK